jgi:Flp pilus assembly CpaF family ATPase
MEPAYATGVPAAWFRERLADSRCSPSPSHPGADATGAPTPTSRPDGLAALTAVLRPGVEQHVQATRLGGAPPLPDGLKGDVHIALRDSLVGLGDLQRLIEDAEHRGIAEIHVNGCDNVWIHYHDGRREPTRPIAGSDEELAAMLASTDSTRSGFLRSFNLPGSGANVLSMHGVTDRVVVTVRLPAQTSSTLEQLVRSKCLTPRQRDFFMSMVRSRCNVVISERVGIGAQTLLGAMTDANSRERRIITIDELGQLRLDIRSHPNMIAMRASSTDGEPSVQQLIRTARRFAPDMLVVGRVHGPEVAELLIAASTGCGGSMTSMCAGSSAHALRRLAAYCALPPTRLSSAAAKELIASAVDFVVHLTETADGSWVVSSIREVIDSDDAQVQSVEVWAPGPDRRAIPTVGVSDGMAARLDGHRSGP